MMSWLLIMIILTLISGEFALIVWKNGNTNYGFILGVKEFQLRFNQKGYFLNIAMSIRNFYFEPMSAFHIFTHSLHPHLRFWLFHFISPSFIKKDIYQTVKNHWEAHITLWEQHLHKTHHHHIRTFTFSYPPRADRRLSARYSWARWVDC